MATQGSQHVAEAYQEAARLASAGLRDASLTIELRRANNFVKDGPIRVCIGFWAHVLRRRERGREAERAGAADTPPPPRLEVIDLCCGRGQDFDKYRRAARDSRAVLSKLVGADLSGGDTAASARERWVQTAQWVQKDRYPTLAPGSANPAVLMGGVLTADLASVHAAQAIDEAAAASRWDEDSVAQPGQAHMASCFFAMHYFFRDASALRNLMAGASWLLRDGGFFAAIHADGELIARRAVTRIRERDSSAAEHGALSMRFGHATVHIHEATAEMLRQGGQDGADISAQPFGWAYDFELPGAVLNVTEYLVHSPTRDRIAESMHLVKLLDESASVLLDRMRGVAFWEDAFRKCEVDCSGRGDVSPQTREALSLYRVVIYGKFPLGCDVVAARRFIRAKLGLGP